MSRLQSLTPLTLAALLLTVVSTVPARAQGSHVAAAPMQFKRALHTMTRLPSGKVVAIGGTDPFLSYESLPTAEVYDLVTDTWTLTHGLHQGREEHVATLLADGSVLVTGGQNPTNVAWYPSTFVLNSAEVYKPSTNAFIPVGPMNEYRLGHQATLLSDGRVLITGGYNNPGIIFGSFGANPPQTTATAEIFDPVSMTFTPVASSMTLPRAYHTATLLADGRVLIVGGQSLPASSSAEIFDPATSTFTAISGPVSGRRRQHGAIRLDDGRVLIAGGISVEGIAEYFHPASETFRPLPLMTIGHEFWSVMTKMTDGRIYMYHGGHAQLFDPAANTFTFVGLAGGVGGVGRSFAAGAALSDNRVLLSGGEDFVPFTFVAVATAKIFIPNDAPVANAGADQKVSPGAGCVAAITLNGSESSDADGDALTFEWTKAGVVVGSSVSVDLSLAPGSHTFTLRVYDGKEAATDEVTIVVVDTMPPSFVSPLPASATLEQQGPAGTLFAIATPAATDSCDASPVVTVTGVPAGSMFPAGATDVIFSATDAAGNHSSLTITVTVRDTIAPGLTVPAPIAAEATSASGADVSYVVSAIDAVTESLTVTCLPASGSVFPIRTTKVECSSTDAAGNTGFATFPVTVRDTIAPVVSVPASITRDATGPAGAPVSYSASATDAVTPSPAVSCSPASGASFPLGTTTVQCSSTDGAGNTGYASFQVTVADTTGPDITDVSSNPGMLWPPNNKMVPVTITAVATESAECRIVNVSSNQPSDNDWTITGRMSLNLRAERLGSGARVYTIGVRCTDAAGNSTLGATTVIVPHDQRR